jgi:thymidylate kinase
MSSHAKPYSIALIGGDGAGKTTIARRLESEQPILPVRVRYLYMGINRESSNVVLPIGSVLKVANRLRHRSLGAPCHDTEPWYWSLLRLAKHIAEESYRQLVSWMYRKQGYTVVYDRHFQFDFSPKNAGGSRSRFDWLHRWFLANIYPHPDLVIFLDAPAEVLFARKHEAGVELLETRRKSFLEQGQRMRNFIRIGADRPLDSVYGDVVKHILEYQQR